MRTDTSQRGFITLASVMMLLVVGLAAALAAFLAAWQSVDGQSAWRTHQTVRSLADACAETARARLWADPAYLGSESLSFDMGRCAILPIDVASGSRDVFAEGYYSGLTARTNIRYRIVASVSTETLEAVRAGRVADY